MPKGFIPSEDTGQIFGITEGAQDISFEAMVRQPAGQSRRCCAPIPTCDAFTSSVGAGGPAPPATPAASSSRLKPRDERKLTPDQVIEELRPKLAAIPGIRVFLQNPPLDPHRRPAQQEPLPVHAAEHRHCRSSTAPRRSSKARCAPLPGFQDVTSDLQITSPQVMVEIDRDQASALGVTAGADRRRAVQRLRPAPGLHHLHPHQPVLGDPGGGAALPARPATRCRCSTCAPRSGQLVPLNAVAKLAPHGRPADRHPPRPAARRDDFVQPDARRCRWARRSTQVQEAVARDPLPRHHQRPASRATAQAFQSSLQGTGLAADRGHPGDLHGAGHSVRELHPPHHDSLRAALGGLRRAGHAAALPHGPEPLRLRRHHHADRHREEERHHDDRLRPRGAARARARRPPTRSTRPAWCASGPS